MRPSRGLVRQGRLRCAAALLVLLSWPPAARALEPTRAITQYGHDIWTRQMGLGEAAYEMVRPPGDYLWLRTSKGLVRFDGVRFVEPLGDDNCMDEPVLFIGKTTEGRLFLRGQTKTCLLKDGRFEPIPPTGDIPDGQPRVAMVDRDGRLWIGADNYVYRSEGDRLLLLRSGTGWVNALLQDREGAVWVGSLDLHRFERDRLTTYPVRFTEAGVHALLEDRHGRIWVGTARGLYQMIDGTFVAAPAARGLAGETITALLEDRDGSIWIGTAQAGVCRLAAGQLSRFTRTDGLLDNEILSLAEDDEGSVWVGTRAGLDRFRDTPFTPITAREGLAGDDVSTVVTAPDGSVFAFSQGGGLTRLADGTATRYGTDQGLPSLYGGILYLSRNGDLWIGTIRGLCRFREGRFTTYSQGPLARGFISAIGEDDEGLILATGSANVGVWRFENGRARPLTIRGQPPPLPTSGSYVFTIRPGDDGSLWLGAVAGLYRLPPPGKAADPHPPTVTASVTSIYDDGEGSLWLGGRAGLRRFQIRDGRVTRYTAAEGLPDAAITGVLGDGHGRLWLNSRRGILSVPRQELLDVAEGRRPSVTPRAYGLPDGMKTLECSDHQPSVARGPDDRLWFTTRRGLVLIDPARLQPSGHFPPVRLEETLADQSTVAPTDGTLHLSAGTQDVQFHYTATSLLVPERIRFRYRLEGYDRDWIDAGTRRVAYYTKLPAGKYRFRVTASNASGAFGPPQASLWVERAPHFYETWLWYAFLVLLAGLALVAAHLLRLRRLRRRHEELFREVRSALARIKTLRGLLPICAGCKRIRSDQGYWEQIEAYVRDHSEATFSHGLCPDCVRELYPEYADAVLAEKQETPPEKKT